MNFGAFAGGLATGINDGMKLTKDIRSMVREQGLQELRDKSMADAEAERAKSVNDLIKEGSTDTSPDAKPSPAATAPVDAAAVSASSPTASPDQVWANSAAAANAASVAAPSAPASPSASPANTPAAAPASPDQPTGTVVQATPVAKAEASPTQAIVAGGTPPVVAKKSGRFSVNGESFDTREEAQRAAEAAAPSATDLFMKNAVPKIAQQYLINGEPDKAKAFQDYSDSYNGKRAIKDWAKAFTAPDFDTAVSRFGEYYTRHIDDGVDFAGHKMLTKADGSNVAVVTLKDKKTGKTTEMEVTREKMLQLAGSHNPQKLFEEELRKQDTADKMKFAAQQKRADREEQRKTEELRQEHMDKRDDAKSEREAARDEARAEREAARDDTKGKQRLDEIEMQEQLRSELAAKYKKTTDPQERRALIRSDAMKNDSRFVKMNKDDQNKYLDDAMDTLNKSDSPQTPAIKAMPYNKDLPVKYRGSDGKPVHIIDGKAVLIEGGIPKAVQPIQPTQPLPPVQAPAPKVGPSAGLPLSRGTSGSW